MWFPHSQRLVTQDPRDPEKVKAGGIVRLQPHLMNPGFIDTTYDDPGRVILDLVPGGLQPCLEGLLKTNHAGLLDRRTPGRPSPCDRVRVALVNLTSSHWFQPQLALWGGTWQTEAASMVKVLVVYALFQLRFDLRQLAGNTLPATVKEFAAAVRAQWHAVPRGEQPAIGELFDLDISNGIEFNLATRNRLDAAIRRNDNSAMGRLIAQAGFRFIGSVAMQSGLFEPLLRGGLWLAASFGTSALWMRGPARALKPRFGHNATALSLAAFYTLLSQFRLVDPLSSHEMMLLLSGGCMTTNFGSVASAAKCGLLPKFRKRLSIHGCKDSVDSSMAGDGALFFDNSVRPALRYVVVTIGYVPRGRFADYARLLRDVESLVRRKAQTSDSCACSCSPAGAFSCTC